MSPSPKINSLKLEPKKQSRSKVIGLVVLVLTIALLSTSYYNRSSLTRTKPEWIHATVVLHPDADPNVNGTIHFIQRAPLGTVKITGEIYGLTPNALRGFHVHEFGDISSGCASTGSHYNPTSQTHGAPKDLVRHVGDLGNVKTDRDGVAILEFEDSVIALSGVWSIIGRAVVVHVGTDDLGRGDNDDSKKTGNAGGRAACGVIGISKASD